MIAATEPQEQNGSRQLRDDIQPISLDARLREVEAELIRWALGVSKGNKSRAAHLLGVKRSTLGDRIRRCGLDKPPATPAAPFHEF